MFVFKLRKKYIFLFVVCLVLVAVFALAPSVFVSSDKEDFVKTIVIDAGHGGVDGGGVGIRTRTTEAELNLDYSHCLSSYFKNFGFRVILTRDSDKGLYSAFSKNKKKDDMQKRQAVIQKARPDVVISIHMNSFPSSSSKGAQCFFRQGADDSIVLATCVQNMLKKDVENARLSAQAGDFFILNCSSYPSVLVECGFLSNPREEALLLSDEHRDKICYAVFCGVVSFFGA